MKAATIHQIKKELLELEPPVLIDTILRLAKYKKESKELLSYLLFDAHDDNGFIEDVKHEIDGQFEEINKNNFYWAKKSVRKILRNINKYIRFSGSKETEVIFLIYFCNSLKKAGLVYKGSTQINNVYESQLKKIKKAMEKLNEDLQFDYHSEIEALEKR